MDSLSKIRDFLKKYKKIPKVIHQIWVGPNPPPYLWINTWRFDYIKNNPEWEYKLWMDDNIFELKYLDIKRYNQEKTWNGKSDFLRFAILKEFGGVYIDADSICIKNKSLNPLIEEADKKGGFFAAWEDHNGAPQKTIAGGVCASYINHPVVNNIMNAQIERWDLYNNIWAAWQTIGPLAVQKGIENSNKNDYVIFPSIYFYPEWWHHYSNHFISIDTDKFTDSYMYQFGYSTNGYSSSDAKHKLHDKERITKSDVIVITNNLNSYKKYKKITHEEKIIYDFIEDFILIIDDTDNTDTEYIIDDAIDKLVNSNNYIFKLSEKTILMHSSKMDMKNYGITFLIRAKNEEKNIDICLNSLVPLLSEYVEIIFVDNNSTDNTYKKALLFAEKYKNIKVFKYDEAISKTGVGYNNTIKISPEKSIAKFYNFCVEKSTKNIIIKWDADFICRIENLKNMIVNFKLFERSDNFALWFTGETLFEHEDNWFLKKNSYYDEFRVFNKKFTKWIDGDKCELLKIDNKGIRLKCDLPVFYEIKRTSIDEFSERGDIIDSRDTDDKNIIENLIKNKIINCKIFDFPKTDNF